MIVSVGAGQRHVYKDRQVFGMRNDIQMRLRTIASFSWFFGHMKRWQQKRQPYKKYDDQTAARA